MGETNVLVLQGGGALGAYQAGAYTALAEAGLDANWVAGISIGAINAALICGNPPEDRRAALTGFWERVTARLATAPITVPFWRSLYGEAAAANVLATGVPGFFTPRWPASFLPFVPHPAISVYDTSPLRKTLLDFVDFDYLNTKGPRLSIGAVDVETANFAYFDSAAMEITPDHIMASGALPPGFAPVEIDGRFYWDGGLVSNTPLQFVMDNLGAEPTLIFQIDLFSARGNAPESLADVGQREKDIRFSSRTRLTTDRYRDLHRLRASANRLAAKLPDALKQDPDLLALQAAGPACPITLVELIHRKQSFEGGTKDYEFSRLSMTQHWAEGREDVARTLNHEAWQGRTIGQEGLQVFDLSATDTSASTRTSTTSG
ncbi:patatin-like phospholipase family protein [Phaeobacter sp. HF9A]|nr:patatin-like phospholipase family protein [Phaeobacter sp. HF9A]